mmetsp:Transcript_69532/g.213160  ORF Transcript_69532/g.213160 Transcript_69532/m.213160 type:complete len:406 (-) Transcript_69532:23-1240(-)
MALPKGPAQQQLEKLDAVFGPAYFRHARLVVTVARDVAGAMKVAHKLQAKLNEQLGPMVEVIFEHVKHELWVRLHDAAATVGLRKGPEVPECQVTKIPEGIRANPYQRECLPTLEVLLLWDDAGATRGHCVYSVGHPECPGLEQVDDIFAEIEPYFAKRWLEVDVIVGPPVKAAFDDDADEGEGSAEGPGEADQQDSAQQAGAGVAVTVLACHAYGFAREQSESLAPHVRHCQPLTFAGVSDSAGKARICFLPAEVNKVHVAETARFHGAEVMLPKAEVRSLDQGPTRVAVRLSPKALAAIAVHVFAMPWKLPAADETDGIVDWAAEVREPVDGASVCLAPLKDGAAPVQLVSKHGGMTFVAGDGGCPEGCVTLLVQCPGYESEERPVMLFVGQNEFYVPLRRMG